MHQMARTKKDDYSHQQDMEQFNQTMTTLRERYDDNRRAGISSENEAEFVAYRLILAAHYAGNELENELHSLPSDLRNNKRVVTAIEIFRASTEAFDFGPGKRWVQAQANWKKYWDVVKSPSVSYLMACAAEVGFNRIRHIILDAIWHAYRRGGQGEVNIETWTTDKLKDVLAMDDGKEAVKFCEEFGFHFEVNAERRTYMDISKLGNSKRSLGVVHTLKPQIFSRGLVESKRHNRAFSAIIQGMTVQQAKNGGLLAETGGDDSLFIPETTPSNPFLPKTNGATTNGTSNPSPFASAFKPPSQPSSGNSTPNHFAIAPSQNQPALATPSFSSGGNSFPGTFNAAKDTIKFAPSSAPSTGTNFFAGAAAKLPPPSTTPTSTPPGSFNFGTNAFPTPQNQPSSSQAPPTFGQTSNPPASDTPKPFVFPSLPDLDAELRSEQRLESSATPAGSPPQPDAAAQAAEKQRAEEAARAAVLKQKQEAEERRKLEQEEQERKAREAREAEHRRVEEEKQRQLREQQQRDLRAKQERERQVREEQQRKEREEQERLARTRRRETAYNALTSNIVFSGEEGLLYQFLENTVKSVADEVTTAVQAERRRKREEAEKGKRQLAFARAVFTHWIAQVQKKKRNAKARERRKRLKTKREQSINGEGEAASEVSAAEPVASKDQQPNGASTTRSAPTNSRRVKRTQERRGSATVDQNTNSQSQAAPSQQTQNAGAATKMTNGHHVRSYSEAYQKSTAPIDQTETDWFKLRAMGIDPSKHRKRSFDSATDEEFKDDAEVKRVRRSDSTASLAQPAPQPQESSKPLTIEERLARIRAAKQSFKTSDSASPPVNGATPGKRSSLIGRSSLLIAQARELIAKSPTAKQSTTSVHDFGRSVPNLGASTSSFRSSILGKSVGAAQGNKPAYWGRASRFVPQHLYGKGPEAIRAYRDQYVNSPTSTPRPLSTEPLALSSPIPTQLSYVPHPGYTQPQYSENGSASGVDLVDVDADDNVPGDTEEDSFDGDDEEAEHDEDEEDIDDPTQFDAYAEEEYDEEEYTEEEDQNFAQPGNSFGPGATQDDAIELSD